MKFLVEEGSYRYIMSGSLLGVEMKMTLHIRQFSCYILIVIRTGKEQANVRLQYC